MGERAGQLVEPQPVEFVAQPLGFLQG